MMHPSTMKLVDRLCAMTKQSKIEWTDGEEAGSLVYDTEGYRVILHGEPANILLTDAHGAELEKVDAADLAQTPHADGGFYEAIVAGLVTDARRIARGTETAISTMLEGLDLDGDGVVDIPMEDGLVPTAAEIADPEPDVVEDTANETGVATLADADVTDMSNAVASLADQVNQNETQIIETDNQRGNGTAAIAGLSAAGLGAAGLVKAARGTPAPTEPDVDTPDLEATDLSMVEPAKNFDLSSATESTPDALQLSPQEQSPEHPMKTAEIEPETILPDLENLPDQVDLPDAAALAKTEFTPPQPGQTLSLSGLTEGKHQEIPIMAGTATTMQGLDHLNVQSLNAATPDAEVPPAPITPPPPAVETPAAPADAEIATPTPAPQMDTPPMPEPTPEPEPQAEAQEEAAEEAPPSSRFNPWI